MARKSPQKKKPKRPPLDVNGVAAAAAGRWTDILVAVAGLPREVLNGKHHPCPRCGGKDRFRLIDQAAGAVLCNQCFRDKNGDGFAAVQWMRGETFPAAVRLVAEYLGIDPEPDNLGSPGDPPKAKPAPDQHLDFRPWNETIVRLWCRHKPPITPEAVRVAGGRVARYRGQYTVIAFPIWGSRLAEADPVGWVIVNTTGRGLPRYGPSGAVEEWVDKPKTTYGSGSGVLGDVSRLADAAAIWKLEGLTDVLAWLSMPDRPPDWAALTNAHGAKERPLKWVAGFFADKVAYVLHDVDRPGQEGALGWEDHGRIRPGWAGQIATVASECRNVLLPYPVAEVRGQDFRDWTIEVGIGKAVGGLRELAAKAEIVAPAEDQPNEAPDDPHRLARLNLERYAAQTGGRTVKFWDASWWAWKSNRYVPMRTAEFRAKVAASVKGEFDRINLEKLAEYRDRKEAGKLEEGEQPPFARKVTPQIVGSVVHATESLVCLSGELQLDTWIPARERRAYVSMENGVLDIEAVLADRDDYLVPHTPEWFSCVHLPYPFNPDATCKTWLDFLQYNLEGDRQRINFLQEWAGYLLLPDTGEQAFLILEGEGANGKSVFCAGMEAILGSDNCSAVPLECFGDRFSKTLTLGRLVNICGDVGELDTMAEGVIKGFTAGNRLMFDRKGESPITTVPTARLMIACNQLPRFRDRSEGIWRRMFVSPWMRVIGPDKRIRNMDKAAWWTATGERPGMFNWALAGLDRFRSQGGFTDSGLMQRTLAEYRLDSNPAKRFLVDHLEKAEEPTLLKCSHPYQVYRKWCQASGYHPLSDSSFGKEVRRTFREVKRIRRGPRGDQTWCYSGIDYCGGAVSGEDLVGAYLIDF